MAFHLKWNTTSIKQTWRTGPIHQRAAWISYWVQLRRDKCRTSSVCPRLPIDRDHHCDVAFYLTTCSLKPYIILFPTHRDLTGGGGGLRRAWVWLYLLFSVRIGIICSNCFHGFWWSPLSCSSKVLRVLNGFRTCCCSLFHLGIIPRLMNITLVNMSLLAEGLTPLNTSLTPPSVPLLQMCQIQLRKASLVAIDLCHYGIPCQ